MEVHMIPEPSEPFGRRRWDPLVDAEQPLSTKNVAPAAGGEAGELDEPSPAPADTSA
jgi:hypothetical protein